MWRVDLQGVIFDGPPGTGKTYLAKGMATEAGVPFFSANGEAKNDLNKLQVKQVGRM